MSSAGLLAVQVAQLKDPRPGDQRANDLKERILGGRTDEGDGAVLDVREQGVLLGLVPAVDLIHEQDRSLAVQPPCAPGRPR